MKHPSKASESGVHIRFGWQIPVDGINSIGVLTYTKVATTITIIHRVIMVMMIALVVSYNPFVGKWKCNVNESFHTCR